LHDSWIFAARPGAIDSVWRAGRKLVDHGRHIAADTIADRYRRTVAALLA
jgi:cytosine/adenosine deaminase-related metal-dependent hydrolase